MPPSVSGESTDLRVLILAPTRRDTEVTCTLLARVRLHAEPCSSLAAMAHEIPHGAGALLLTDTALGGPQVEDMLRALAAQPAWSDVPVVLSVSAGSQSSAGARAFEALRNVTLLERPTTTRSVVSAVQAAIRSRRRQYEIRDQLQSIRQGEQALRQIAADLSESIRRQREFLATLAHELRNPLASISAGLEVIRQVVHDAAAVERCRGMMERQTRQLVRLVDDQLDISRIMHDRLQLRKQSIDLGAVLQQAVEAMQPAVEAAGHSLRLDLPGEPAPLYADPHRLVQVFSNLLHNAVKFTPPGGRISLRASRHDGSAVVTIQDSGIGIPPAMQPRIFEMFARGERADDSHVDGLGIGLTLVQRLLEMHEGEVAVFSEGPGTGSTFTVRLPMAASPGQPARHGRAEPARARTLRILVVDDNQDAAETMALMLGLHGDEVQIAHDGQAAVAAAERFQPDVIFMDIGMPRMNGYEAAALIRAQPWGGGMTMVALTGWGQEEDRQRATAAGFDDHLTKPASPEALERVLAGAR